MAVEDLYILRQNALKPFCFPIPNESVIPVFSTIPSRAATISQKIVTIPLPKMSAREQLAGRRKTNRHELTRLSALIHLHKLKPRDIIFDILPPLHSKSNSFSVLADSISAFDFQCSSSLPKSSATRIPRRLRDLLRRIEPIFLIALEDILLESLYQAPVDPANLVDISLADNIKFIVKISSLTRFQRLLIHCICDFHNIFAQSFQSDTSAETPDLKDMAIYCLCEEPVIKQKSILTVLYPNRNSVYFENSSLDSGNSLIDLFRNASLSV